MLFAVALPRSSTPSKCAKLCQTVPLSRGTAPVAGICRRRPKLYHLVFDTDANFLLTGYRCLLYLRLRVASTSSCPEARHPTTLPRASRRRWKVTKHRASPLERPGGANKGSQLAWGTSLALLPQVDGVSDTFSRAVIDTEIPCPGTHISFVACMT